MYLTGTASMTMSGSIIENNKAGDGKLEPGYNTENFRDESTEQHFGSGGGIFSDAEGQTVKIEGGTIQGNHAIEGGGIMIDRATPRGSHPGAKLVMTGGVINGNIAYGGEGGGIYVQTIQDNIISGGEISNNKTYTIHDLGGGGIYVEECGKLAILNAAIYDNSADGLGGGVAACVHGKTATVDIQNGAAIYSNTAKGTAIVQNRNHDDDDHSNDHSDIDYSIYWSENDAFKAAATDIFSGDNYSRHGGAPSYTTGHPGAIISNSRLGGDWARWEGFRQDVEGTTFIPLKYGDVDSVITSLYLLGLKAGNTDKPAEDKVKLRIFDNTSTTHGGGVGVNGMVTFGEFPTEPIEIKNTAVSLELSKALHEKNGTDISSVLKGGEFTFGLYPHESCENDSLITTTTNGFGLDAGRVVLSVPGNYFSEAGEYYLYVKEIPSVSDAYKYECDTTIYCARFNIKSDTKTVGGQGANGNTVVNPITITTLSLADPVTYATKNASGEWVGLTLDKDQHPTFSNVQNPIDVTVTKNWVGENIPDDIKAVTVQLYADGKQVKGKTATLTKDALTVTWEGLDRFQPGTNTEIEYTVREMNGQAPLNEGDTFTITKDDVAYTFKVSYNGTTITNTLEKVDPLTVDVSVTKEWSDDTPIEAKQSIRAKLYTPNGETLAEVAGQEAKTLNADGNWTATWKDLPKYQEDGTTKINYVVRELDAQNKVIEDGGQITFVNGETTYDFTVAYGGQDNAHTITNTLTDTHLPTVEVTVTKNWVGKDIPDAVKEAVKVQLYKGETPEGEPKGLTYSNEKWTASWTNLDKYDSNGNIITYTVRELNAKNEPISDKGQLAITKDETVNGETVTTTYKFTVTYDDATHTITNTYFAPDAPSNQTVDVTVRKDWVGDNIPNEVKEKVTVQLLADGKPNGAPITLTGAGSWTNTWKGLPKYQDDTTTEIVYTVKEVGEENGKITISHNGQDYVFTVTYTTDEKTGDLVITNTVSEPTTTPPPSPPLPTPTPTDDDDDDPDPTPTPSTSPTPTPSPTPDPSPEPSATPEPTPTPTPTPTPEVEEFPDGDTPLGDLPGTDDAILPGKEDFEELDDGDTPLADVPATGDSALGWLSGALGSALGLVWVTLGHRKRENGEE